MIFHRFALASTFAIFASAKALEKVNISIQPAYHAIPIYATKVYGWFEELGLNVSLSLYASGGPQVKAAVEDKAWDFGIAGSVPCVLAGAQGIHTIGINNDESATTDVVGGPGVTEWPPQNLRDGILAATPNSTSELLLRLCMEIELVNISNSDIMFAQQKDVVEALTKDSDPQYACLWAPHTHTYKEANPKAKVFCSGRNIDFPIYGGLMVREEYALNNQDAVARILAGYLRGVTFMQNPNVTEEVLQISAEYYEFAETPLSENALKEDLILRPLFNLDKQLDRMSRNFDNGYISDFDAHYLELEEFLFQQGVIREKSAPRKYITDEYMKLVGADPELRAYSYHYSAKITEAETLLTSSSQCNYKLGAGEIAGIALGFFGGVCLL